MKETDRIVHQLRRAYAGEAWHGPALLEMLQDVTPQEAIARPIPWAHSIWEIVLHATSWVWEVTRRLQGGTPGMPEAGDWPEVTAVGEKDWNVACSTLGAAHEELAIALQAFHESELAERVGSQHSPAEGTGTTYYAMLHGLAQHDAYHGGQISLLKLALRGVKGSAS